METRPLVRRATIMAMVSPRVISETPGRRLTSRPPGARSASCPGGTPPCVTADTAHSANGTAADHGQTGKTCS